LASILISPVIIFFRRGIMKIELTEDELLTLQVLLLKEIEDTKVEIHHSKNHDYKTYLKERETLVNELILKIEKTIKQEP
jgi:hypothetical protein